MVEKNIVCGARYILLPPPPLENATDCVYEFMPNQGLAGKIQVGSVATSTI